MYYSRLVLSIYLEEKEDQSSYLECIKPYKKPSIDGFFLLNLISSIWLQWLKHVDIPLGINAGMHPEFLHRYR